MKKWAVRWGIIVGIVLLALSLITGIGFLAKLMNDAQKADEIRAERNDRLQDQFISEALGGVSPQEFLYEEGFFSHDEVTYKGNKYKVSFEYDDDGNIVRLEKFVQIQKSEW